MVKINVFINSHLMSHRIHKDLTFLKYSLLISRRPKGLSTGRALLVIISIFFKFVDLSQMTKTIKSSPMTSAPTNIKCLLKMQ